MSDHNEPWVDVEPYWEQERMNDRDEYDLHLRHVEVEERERLEEHE